MSNSNRDTLRDIIVERLSATEAREEPDVFESVLEIYSRVDMDCSVRDFDRALDSLVIDGLVSRPLSKLEGIDLLRLQSRRPRATIGQRLLAGWAKACHYKCKTTQGGKREDMSEQIDLLPFCDPSSSQYPGIGRPFQFPDSPWLYASDGKIVVRVPAVAKSEPVTLGATPSCLEKFPWPEAKDDSWKQWPEKAYDTHRGNLCQQCGGDDYGLIVACVHCDVKGRGYLQKIGEAVIQRHYDILIRKLPDVQWILVDLSYSSPLVAFHFTGGEGLVCQNNSKQARKA